MLFRRCLTMIAMAVASLATSACADLTRPNEITIKAEPKPVAAPVAPGANAPNPGATGQRPTAPAGGG